MGKRGPKPKGKVAIKWSPNFAYAIGLIVTDGNLSSDGRHISFASKDIEQVENIMLCLGLESKIGRNVAGHKKSSSFRVQFGDVLFYKFLVNIGVSPAKSKTISKIKVPDEYFFDFLRGVFDGDGYIHSYYDPRWKSSFMWYLGFCSASIKFLEWIRETVSAHLKVRGHITKSAGSSCLQLKYAKIEAKVVVSQMYKNKSAVSLSRKKLKLNKILAIVAGNRRGQK